MIGWLIAAGIAGAVLSDVAKANSKRVHDFFVNGDALCNSCNSNDVHVREVDRDDSYVKYLFVCRHCGRRWTKTYRAH